MGQKVFKACKNCRALTNSDDAKCLFVVGNLSLMTGRE